MRARELTAERFEPVRFDLRFRSGLAIPREIGHMRDGRPIYDIRGAVTGASASDFHADRQLNKALRNTDYTSPATLYLALFTTAPTDAFTSGSPTGVEVTTSGTGYARQVVAFGAPGAASPTGRQVANSSDVLWAVATANYGTVVAAAIVDAVSGACNLLYWIAGLSQAINTGNRAEVLAGNATVVVD
jgi:hypothetical protein